MTHRSTVLLTMLCLSPGVGLLSAAVPPRNPLADEPAAPPINSQVMPAFQALADQTSMQMEWKAGTVEEHEAWRDKFHAKLIELLGRMPAPVEYEVKWTEEKDLGSVVRHKLYIRTQEDYFTPVYYFVPKERTGKRPAMVCLHGHSGVYPYIREGTEAEKAKCRKLALDYAVYFAEHGYVTAAPVVRGWNETKADGDPAAGHRSCRRVTMDTFLLGMTPMGLRCWDAMRVIDFLQRQPQVDAAKIGVAGLSGGGVLALYLPVLDERVKLAMIAGAFSSYRTSTFVIPHCICNCLPGIMQYGDMAEVVALHAPRPVLLINGVHDSIFPIKEARQGYEKLRRVYALLGVPENLDADFFDGPHSWSNNKTLAFLERHFGR